MKGVKSMKYFLLMICSSFLIVSCGHRDQEQFPNVFGNIGWRSYPSAKKAEKPEKPEESKESEEANIPII